jgi:hypothetical protein
MALKGHESSSSSSSSASMLLPGLKDSAGNRFHLLRRYSTAHVTQLRWRRSSKPRADRLISFADEAPHEELHFGCWRSRCRHICQHLPHTHDIICAVLHVVLLVLLISTTTTTRDLLESSTREIGFCRINAVCWGRKTNGTIAAQSLNLSTHRFCRVMSFQSVFSLPGGKEMGDNKQESWKSFHS